MKIFFTVAPGRRTALSALTEVRSVLVPPIEAAGFQVEYWQPPELPWLDWLHDAWAPFGEFSDSLQVPPCDVLIGCELPPNVRINANHWLDIRLHPIRFMGTKYWSVVGPQPLDIGPWVQPPQFQPHALKEAGAAAFACQVSYDSALIHEGRVLKPENVMEGIKAFAEGFTKLYVCPHPVQPRGSWVDAVLPLPNAELAGLPTYDVLRRVTDVCTVSSSIGQEAPYFGCTTTWLKQPFNYSPPVVLNDQLWKAVLSRYV